MEKMKDSQPIYDKGLIIFDQHVNHKTGPTSDMEYFPKMK